MGIYNLSVDSISLDREIVCNYIPILNFFLFFGKIFS